MSRAYRAALAAAGVGALAACGLLSSQPPSQPSPPPPHQVLPPPAPAVRTPLLQPAARWLPADWSELPGWGSDRTLDAWGALRRTCERPQRLAVETQRLCADALRTTPSDDAAARAWLEQRLQPYRVMPLDANAPADGLATGYFEPLLDASRAARGAMRVPLWSPPADLATRRPWYTRAQIDTLPAAQAALRGREIVFVADPLDALLLQVQGSGRARVTEPDGRVQTVRLAYAGHNDHGYVSVGRWLIDQGELKPGEASWPAIRDWARRNPQRVSQMLAANPRVVFFREEPLPDPTQGPRGALGVPLTPERSVAVDPSAIPLGSALWIDTTEPLSATPLRRLVMAQDTGSAITGAVRIDYFWGPGESALAQAGRMKQPLRVWVLWPRP